MLKRFALLLAAFAVLLGASQAHALNPVHHAKPNANCTTGPYLPLNVSVPYAWAYGSQKMVQTYKGPLYKVRLVGTAGPQGTTQSTLNVWPTPGCDQPDWSAIRAFTGGQAYSIVLYYDQKEVLGGWAAATNSNGNDATLTFSTGTVGAPPYGNPQFLTRLPYGPNFRGATYPSGAASDTLAGVDSTTNNNNATRGNFSITSRLAATRVFVASAGSIADVNPLGTLGSTTGRVAAMLGDTWGQFHTFGAWVGTTGANPTYRVTTTPATVRPPSNWPAMYLITNNAASSIRFCINTSCETKTTAVGGGAFSIAAGAYTVSTTGASDAGTTPTTSFGKSEVWADVGLNGAANSTDEGLLAAWSKAAFNLPTHQPRVNVVWGGSSTPDGYKGIGTGVPANLASMLGPNARSTTYGNAGSFWSDVNGDSATFLADAKDASATYNVAVGYAGRNEINGTNATTCAAFATGASQARYDACADLAVAGAQTFCDNAIAAGYDYCIIGTLYDTNWGNNSTTTATDFSRAQSAAARYNGSSNGIQSTTFLTGGSRNGKVFIADSNGAVRDSSGGTTNSRLNCWPTTTSHIVSGSCNATSQDAATMDSDQVHALLGGAAAVAAAFYAAIPSAVRTAAQ